MDFGMEWLTVNDMLHDEITKLNSSMIPPGFQGDVRTVRVMQESLSAIIDKLGEQSAAAQGLSKVITTAEKLRNSPTYTLYLLKDPQANGGKGEVIGLLKVGRKHLFLFDERERVCEVEPLCVLDFFVQGSRQRCGYGRMLFDYMLHDMETSAHLLAVDGPSPKMEQFLVKNYGIEHLVRQNNNFAVSPQFFNNLSEIRLKEVSVRRQILEDNKGHTKLKMAEASKPGNITPVSTPAVGRYTAKKPNSTIGKVIHGNVLDVDGAFSDGTPEDEALTGTPKVQTPAAEAPVQAGAAAPEAPEAEPAAPRALERPNTLHVETAPAASLAAVSPAPAAVSPAGSTTSRRDSQLTDRGYFDVKFYHNKLW